MHEWGSWPLVGRAEELALIAGALGAAAQPAGVAVVGALGVGKTRLVRDALAKAPSGNVHWVAGSSAARKVELGAFVQWLPDGADLDARAPGRVVARLASGQRPVVGVDDAHLLDDTSVFVLHRLSAHRLATVVLTVRNDAGVPAPLAALWRDGALRRLDLQPLGRPECATLLGSILGGPVDPVGERRLWQLTRGNVRYLHDILTVEADAGRLHRVDGTWTWSPGPTLPASVCELVEQQFGELPDAVAEALDLLAVAEALPVAVLVDLVGASAAEDAEGRRLIVVDGGAESHVRLAHPLYGAVRRATAGRIRLRRLRGAVAARMARAHVGSAGDAGWCARRAELVLESDLAASAEDMVQAARAALWRGDGALALRCADTAAAAGGGPSASGVRAEALNMLGRTTEAESVLNAGDTEPGGDLVLTRAQTRYLRSRTGEALAGLCPVPAGPASTGGAAAMVAFLRACDGDLTGASLAADRARTDPGLPDAAAGYAAIAKVVAAGETGHGAPASLAEPAATLGSRSTATSFLRFALAEATAVALQLRGDLDGAMAAVDAVRDDDLPADVYCWVRVMTGAVSLGFGRVDAAVSQIRDVMTSPRLEFLGGWLCRYRFDLAVALAQRGEADAARSCLDRLGALPHPTVVYLDPMESLAHAWISAASGAVSGAVAAARQAAVAAASRGQAARETVCLQTATRFGDRTTAPRLAELARAVDGPRVSVAAGHAAALTAGDGDQLMTASRRYESMGDMLSAVDAAAQASTAFARADRRGSALAAAARYRGLATRCGEVRTPALTAAVAPAGLTGREREIVALAARGLTNRAIAQRLQLSVRTVEGHIYRAAERIGAHDRKELARALLDTMPASA